MIVFPSNPTVGQTYDVGDRTFRFNGKGWVVSGLPGGVVTQTTGQSIVDVMSQKAVTDALGEQKSDSGITSTQDLPSLNLLAGATQKAVNGAQNDAIEELNGRVDDINSSINDINSSIGITINDINGSINDINVSIDDINVSIDDINGSINDININNEEQDLLNANHEQRLDIAEAQLAGNQLTFAAIYGYYNFI